MNQALWHRISFDFRSADLARVCLALATTHSKAAWQCHYQGKAIGPDLNGHPLAMLSSPGCHTQPGCLIIQSP
jgi:hypothetical protein